MASSGTSPGIYVNEMDFTAYAAALAGTVCCIVGGASKGPVNQPTLVSNVGSLVAKFGKLLLNDHGLQAATRFLSKGRNLLYLRVAHSPATADVAVAGTTGGTAAIQATGSVTFTTSTNPSDAMTITIGDGTVSKVFEFDNNGALTSGTNIGVLIGASAAATRDNLISAINNSPLNVIASDGTSTVPKVNLKNRTGGTAGNVTITTSSTPPYAVAGMSAGAAAVNGTSASVMRLHASSPGSWGNDVVVTVVVPSTNPAAESGAFDLIVTAPPYSGTEGVIVERFSALSLNPASDRYAPDALTNGLPSEAAASQYLTLDALTTGTPNAGTYTLGTSGGTSGTDGISGLVDADYVGTVSGNTATGLRAVLNAESVEYNALAIPGVNSAAVIAAAVSTVEARGDAVFVLDPPFGVDSDTVVSWSNGDQPGGVPNSPAEPINSTYAFLAAPWIQAYDPYNQQSVWVPPSGDVMALMASADDAVGPSSVIGGLVRGVLTGVLKLEYSPDQSTRDTMIGLNFVNPLVSFPASGPVLLGNKTLGRTPGPMQDLNSRRAMIYIKKIIATAGLYLTFEPNDPTTQLKFKMLCNPPLQRMAAQRGISNFQVVCDATNNPTDSPQAQKTLNGQILVQWLPVTERIAVSFASTTDGAQFTSTTASSV